MILSEEEKEDIKKKYEGIHSKDLLNHLKRNFPIYELDFKFRDHPLRQIYVDEKLYDMSGNKKFLVNKISSSVEESFPHIEKGTLRRTVKYYLDILK